MHLCHGAGVRKQKFDGEGKRTGAFSFDARKRTRKGCVCRRKSCKHNEKLSCRPPLPGRPAKLATLCAKRTAKNRWTGQKMNAFIFWLAIGFSYARKLSLRHSIYRRKLLVVVFKPVRPDGSRAQAGPGAELEGLERPERLPVAGFQRKAGRKAPDRRGLERVSLPISVYPCHTAPWAIMAVATFRKPAMLAPST